jgi:hypothetical protein
MNFSQDEYDRDYELKERGLENVLGEMHGIVGVPRDDEENRYVIFDLYQPANKEFKIGERKHHLLCAWKYSEVKWNLLESTGAQNFLNY